MCVCVCFLCACLCFSDFGGGGGVGGGGGERCFIPLSVFKLMVKSLISTKHQIKFPSLAKETQFLQLVGPLFSTMSNLKKKIF